MTFDFKFQINPIFLFVYSWYHANKDKPSSKWWFLKQRVEKSKKGDALMDMLWWREYFFASTFTLESLQKSFKNITIQIEKLSENIAFQKILEETKKHKKYVTRQWNINREKSLKLFDEITGLKLPSKKVSILVLHPEIGHGMHIASKNLIFWGHKEEWENYTTAYLFHELMHLLTIKKTTNQKVMHALIELATDNELRIRLNGKGKYFEIKGHKELRPLEKKILPYWKEFLNGKFGNSLFALEKDLSKRFKLENDLV